MNNPHIKGIGNSLISPAVIKFGIFSFVIFRLVIETFDDFRITYDERLGRKSKSFINRGKVPVITDRRPTGY